MGEKILIVEDIFIEANNLQMIMERAGYTVSGIAASVEVALQMVEQDTPDFVLIDIYLKGKQTGIDLARILRQRNIAFIYLSANSTKQTLDQAKATFPYGFLVKPFREREVLVTLEIARYLHANSLEALLRKGTAEPHPHTIQDLRVHGIVGDSPQLQRILQHLLIVAPADTSVLITGESGTGKEKMAELIHRLSDRASRPLIKVNCAAMSTELIESLLFGHEKGSFTGAVERRIGKFEQANGGTIFLDEIGEMPLEVQVKLLRVLQEREIERIGAARPLKVDVRIISATSRDLEKEVAEGRFRMDFYYRLNVFPLHLPPLRERREDVPALIRHFLELHCRNLGKPPVTVTQKVIEMLTHYSWPGNIRELENLIERATLMCEGNTISYIALPEKIDYMPLPKDDRIKTIQENEREHIIRVLRRCNGKIFGKGGAAELLSMNVSTLNYRIRKLGINKDELHLPG
ncbi:sigma-54-dependent transcriptional regulator [Chitinophaga rhizophila]|uniref:Sigma-54 dependent transcriptional regulator n=1 Tax=Chitinophaga rhizophila TaxID=2866212 RepID=A0ABS7GM03_9BACT|nr:sigma-54 dependent transcriptional regulator [Chitinophaga rhizophila]MBW8688350.1 sigma-54 dependent transcriptional regulator [Chitinophaga rhizophila]